MQDRAFNTALILHCLALSEQVLGLRGVNSQPERVSTIDESYQALSRMVICPVRSPLRCSIVSVCPSALSDQ